MQFIVRIQRTHHTAKSPQTLHATYWYHSTSINVDQTPVWLLNVTLETMALTHFRCKNNATHTGKHALTFSISSTEQAHSANSILTISACPLRAALSSAVQPHYEEDVQISTCEYSEYVSMHTHFMTSSYVEELHAVCMARAAGKLEPPSPGHCMRQDLVVERV